MCGIFFYMGNKYKFENLFLNYNKIMRRGPDKSKIVDFDDKVFVFHRLAINDLSDNGMQPFILDDIYLICNGEIYNYKMLADKYNFNFPYLYDSSQDIAKKYNAICTPDFYGFNKNLELHYRGRIDSGVMKNNNDIKRELYYAMEKIIKSNIGPKEQFNSFGCSIKWKNENKINQ